ncbi:MAG: ribonuclease D [Gammaproteobacteria bacterium]
MPPTLIDTPAGLDRALAALAGAEWIAVDTEFLRERTYYPKLCLLQLAGGDADFVIDPLALSDLSPVHEFLAEPHRVKILHAARQDLEALQRGGIALRDGLFDTQTAATLIGHPEQVSYAWLVAHFCDVSLDKSQTRTDWSRRPLSDAQLLYAQDDVRYLGRLYAALRSTLAETGKLAWLWEETAALDGAMVAAEDPEQAWRRLRGLGGLPGPLALARGKALARWREHTAQQEDLPRGWLLKDEVLLAVAALASLDMHSLGALPGIAPATVRRHGSELLHVHGTANAEDAPPQWRLTSEGNRLLGELQADVRRIAAENNVAPGLLASRRDLEALLLGEPPARMLTGWRGALLGVPLRARADALPLEARRQAAEGGPRPRRRN